MIKKKSNLLDFSFIFSTKYIVSVGYIQKYQNCVGFFLNIRTRYWILYLIKLLTVLQEKTMNYSKQWSKTVMGKCCGFFFFTQMLTLHGKYFSNNILKIVQLVVFYNHCTLCPLCIANCCFKKMIRLK